MKYIPLALAALGLMAAPAFAQQGMGKQVREACQADYKAFCSGVQPGGGRILKCFEEHKEQLSKECVSALQEAKAARDGAQ